MAANNAKDLLSTKLPSSTSQECFKNETTQNQSLHAPLIVRTAVTIFLSQELHGRSPRLLVEGYLAISENTLVATTQDRIAA